jgi:uncharacterized protein YggE
MKSLCLIFLLWAQFAVANNPQLISVNGIGERSVDPNIVIINLEIFGKSVAAKAAQDLQAKEYNRIKSIVEKFKIKKDDFITQNFSINPEYTYDPKTQISKLSGYRVSHQVQMTYKKVDDAGQLIDALTSTAKVDTAGVQIQSISWDSDKKSPAESEAMIDAVQAAKDKAEKLAKAAGVKIKNVYLISQTSGSESVAPVFSGNMKAMAMESVHTATAVQGGQIKVKSEVLMQFEIN